MLSSYHATDLHIVANLTDLQIYAKQTSESFFEIRYHYKTNEVSE